MQWFRMYAEVIDDKKLRRIALRTKQNKLIIIGFWTTFLALANGGPKRGELLLAEGQPISDEEIMLDMDLDPNIYHALMREFIAAGMIGQGVDGTYFIPAWDKRQFKSDNTTARTRKYKEGKTGTTRERSGEQPGNVPGNAPDTETDTDTDLKPPAPKKPAQTRKPNQYNQDQAELEKHFCIVTGLPMPKTNTEKQKGAARSQWWVPLQEIYELVEKDKERGKQLITEAVAQMRGGKTRLTIGSPNSILKIARDINGIHKVGGGTASPELLEAQKKIYGN